MAEEHGVLTFLSSLLCRSVKIWAASSDPLECTALSFARSVLQGADVGTEE